MTVEECGERMSMYELRGWQLFEEKYGPLHLSMRFDAAIARAVAPFIKNFKREHFMPWPVADEAEEGGIEAAFNLVKAAKKDPRKRGKRRGKRGVTNGEQKSRDTNTRPSR